jgi:2-dehydro-3-deoxyphosphogalactonate aldolase
MNLLGHCLAEMPLIAILRGIAPQEAMAVGQALYDAGLRCIEVPLNSPQPFASIEALARSLPGDCLVGAGTVLRADQVARISDAGGKLVVMPHSDPVVILAAKAAGLVCAPGVATPTEAYAALGNGADALKLFPAEQLTPEVLKAWRAVLPPDVMCIPVGGITTERVSAYWNAGARGFGIGSAIYKPGLLPAEVAARAAAFVEVAKALLAPFEQ